MKPIPFEVCSLDLLQTKRYINPKIANELPQSLLDSWHMLDQLILITLLWHIELLAFIGEDDAVTTKGGCIKVWV